MNRKLMLVFITITLLACNFLFPPKSIATPESIVAPIGFTIVRLHPKDGDLPTMLADEAQKAIALGQMPIVEFDATWCPPCRAIDKAIKANNKLMLQAYSGTYIIKLDVDEWGWKDGKVQDFQFDAIPVYFKLDSEGNQTGDVIDGGAWGEDIPENIAPVMDKFFHGG
ncbi:MAG TPA: thioredoxin domain-containing protein [Anaerolineales bacterium]